MLPSGILRERQCEIITDHLRALILEAHGYKTKVFEFISTEHTGKNVMITAIKHDKDIKVEAIETKIEALKSTFGVEQVYLQTLL